MSDIINPMLQWLYAHPNLSGLATFIISAAESVAIIGTIVPGSIMMTAIGALAGAGVIPLWPSIFWAILGAIVGDGISYWLGFYLKDRVRNIWPFKGHPELLAKGENFFTKYGAMSVFIGRFVGPVRALVPMIAGMFGMSPWRFTIFNVASALGWAPLYMLPGILLGAASLELRGDMAGHFMMAILLITLFTILCIWSIQKMFTLINEQVNQFLNWIWMYLQRSPKLHPLATTLKHYDHHRTHGQLTLAFYFLVASILFVLLTLDVRFHGASHIVINDMLFHLFRSFRTPEWDSIMICLTMLGEKFMLFPVVIALFVWLLWRKNYRTAGHVLAATILTAGSIWVVKHLIHSPRPWGILANTETYSFPSGHVGLATTFYFGLLLLLGKAYQLKRRWMLYLLAGTIVTLIGISRLYLGAHWFTDVLGSLLLSTAILMLVILSYNRKAESKLYPNGILVVTLLSFLISYSYFYYHRFHSMQTHYVKMSWPVYTIDLNNWWQQKGSNLPLYRVNRFGETKRIFNIQWVGNLTDIQQVLLKNHWEIPPEHDWVTILKRITDVESAENVPLVSPLHLDQRPALVLVKQSADNKKLIVLQLWDSYRVINHISQPLWVGEMDYVPRTFSWIFKNKRNRPLEISSSLLFNQLPAQYEIKQVMVKVKSNRRNHFIDLPILLIKPKS